MSEMAQTTGNIDHAARAHAALSASSSHRWLMCPPSVKLSEQFEDKPSFMRRRAPSSMSCPR